MIKATKVDGIYTADPLVEGGATLYEKLSYDEVLNKKLDVMDATAIVLCRDNAMPLRVVNMMRHRAFLDTSLGRDVGTMVTV